MKSMVDEIQLKLSNFVKRSGADAIAFVSSTCRREVQNNEIYGNTVKNSIANC